MNSNLAPLRLSWCFDARIRSPSLCFHVWRAMSSRKRVWRAVGAGACTFLLRGARAQLHHVHTQPNFMVGVRWTTQITLQLFRLLFNARDVTLVSFHPEESQIVAKRRVVSCLGVRGFHVLVSENKRTSVCLFCVWCDMLAALREVYLVTLLGVKLCRAHTTVLRHTLTHHLLTKKIAWRLPIFFSQEKASEFEQKEAGLAPERETGKYYQRESNARAQVS